MTENNNHQVLPSNRVFGGFFGTVFLCVAAYTGLQLELKGIALILTAAGVFLITLGLINSPHLTPLNSLWMQLGLLLGRIMNPIIMAIIFFSFISPYGTILRILNRDQLRLTLKRRESHWVKREADSNPPTNFRRQF